MVTVLRRTTRWSVALAATALLAASFSTGAASAQATIECQHPVMTGVEIFKLHNVASSTACPVALALFHWETSGENGHNERALYGCHGIGHPYLRLHSFHGWHLALTPDFVMSRDGASFSVTGTDFPINCT
jgi:hypothetical protein